MRVLTLLTICHPPPLYLTLAIVDMHAVITAHCRIFSGSVKPHTEWNTAVKPTLKNSWLTPSRLLTPNIKSVRTEYLLGSRATVCLYQNVYPAVEAILTIPVPVCHVLCQFISLQSSSPTSTSSAGPPYRLADTLTLIHSVTIAQSPDRGLLPESRGFIILSPNSPHATSINPGPNRSTNSVTPQLPVVPNWIHMF